ncbi:hypothetical protein CRUP_015304 [Coryphaenoides rupestris]|nr:hypothetical protein CRUP_015304 [Coryphaenoides rupestris]
MPSDFISLLTSDLDLNSPKSVYSKESVYDLLPKELQLQPRSAQTDTATATSQKSGEGGEAGPPPSAALASDATSSNPSIPSSLGMGAPCSGPSTAAPTLASEHLKAPQHLHPPSGGDGPGADVFGAEGAQGCGTSGNTAANTALAAVAGEPGAGLVAQPHQNTPSKRRPVLSISPPPEDLLDDSQMSCQEEAGASGTGGPDSEHSSSMWADDSASNFSLVSSSSYNDNTEVPRKSRKRTPRQRPGPKPALPEDSMDVFDADSAKAPHFVLSQLGSDKAGPKASSLETAPLVKGGLLSGQYPQKVDGKELKILVQPESQHRARYLTEGSRGSVKDRTQQSFPQVKLEGVNEPVVLQVFVANDTGRVKPHGFYQACRVTGRNTTACTEVEIEGTTVIEIPLEPSNDMTLALDCVGILKLRNADVEARIGMAGSKKKSTRARLAFRVNIPQPDGSFLTLQMPSLPILCKILKKSLHSASVKGGEEVFIVGKNFLKGTKVIFQENITDDASWQAEAKIDMDLFHQNHLIVTVPPYHNLSITSPITVGIFIVTNAGRSHDAQTFTYTPDSVDNTTLMAVKTEATLKASTCQFDAQLKSMTPEQAESCTQPPKPQEITPMEVSSNSSQTHVFKAEPLVSVQKNLELNSNSHPSVESFASPMPLQPEDVELPQVPPVFSSLEPLSNIQKQDISPTPSYPMSAPSQPQTQQASIFPEEGVAQLERAVMELQAENTTLQQQQQNQALNVLQQQQQNQALSALQQQQQQNQALNVLQQQQQQNQVLSTIHQQQQQNQALGALQQQQHQVLNIIQRQHQQSQALSTLQQQQNQALQQQQMQEQQVLENFKNQLQAELLQPQIHCPQSLPTPQAPQAVSLLQQTGELLTIQTSFPQQTPPHTSPPQQLFQSSGPISETQQQVQATLLPSTLAVLTSVSLNPEQQATGSTLFLSPNPQQPQQQQQTGLAFLSSMETSASEPQSVNLFQNPQQTQLSAMQQQSMPMEQQQTPPQQQTPQIPVVQQGSMFQSLSSQASPLPQSQLTEPQPTDLLLCTTDLSPQAIPPALLFSTQSQDSSALGSIGVRVGMPQQDVGEPMSFQEQSSLSCSSSSDPRQQSLFQEQQPMQVAPCSGGVSGSQPVELFLPQASISSLQNSMDTQELSTQVAAAGTTIFVVQGGVGVVTNPGQQPADQFFQASVSGNSASQGQPKVFVFGIQNDPAQLLSSPGTGMAAQSQQPLLDTPMAQTGSSMQAPMHSGLAGTLQTNLQGQMQSSLGSAMQADLQNAMQTGGTLCKMGAMRSWRQPAGTH